MVVVWGVGLNREVDESAFEFEAVDDFETWNVVIVSRGLGWMLVYIYLWSE